MRVAELIGWLLAGLLAASPAFSDETAVTLQTGFDRTALDMELSLSLGELRRQGADALRAHVEGLAQHYAALERAPGISSDPNRFYEIVVCDGLESLDRLTGDRSELAGLAARIEACWLPGRPVVRRAWWGVLAGRSPKPGRDSTTLASSQPREDLVS